MNEDDVLPVLRPVRRNLSIKSQPLFGKPSDVKLNVTYTLIQNVLLVLSEK